MEDFRFFVTIPIRYGDIDAQRHLNNVAYFTFMEQARVAYLRETGMWRSNRFDDVGTIVAEASCRFTAPAYLWDTVTVWMRVTRLGNKSYDCEYRLRTERGEIAVGRTIQVCYDYTRGKSLPLPDEWREAITAYEPALETEPAGT